MSYDFAVIPVDSFETVEQALRICDAMYDEPQGRPSPQVVQLIDELERHDNTGHDGLVSMWPIDADARGALVCTRAGCNNTYAMLNLTKDRGLAVVDVQVRRLYDPRSHVDVQVSLGDGTNLPYLTAPLLEDLIARPHRQYPWLVVARGDHWFIQAHFAPDADCVLEYRDGGPERHFGASTSDRAVVPTVIWQWVIEDPAWRVALCWQRADHLS
ncbi:hypothetical protein [Mycobacterium avium]|uniref:Uncharacterized protein n=3 Tax=Mycobacterium TaxID=1763 RepID=A0A2A3LCQ7_MYCAV|nr:hypothetical protein [Mycobacterium avium]PBJ38737.1 hypothetical protein XV03_04475 [Mycobacterium avium subsp. hominissuis]PBJ66899.1 hypothetical protein BB737_05105 [Mycobacterium avium subsp. hominissuis]